MRIAFTHNLQLNNNEAEAEFDTAETVHFISDALRALGHEVENVECGGSASRLVARLEALAPDLVFNTAEGTHGRFREAFFPALFDRLSLPFTGSDAYVCALTLDKQLSKMIVQRAGVQTPKWIFVDDVTQLDVEGMRFPLIVKPNFEGSSKGITMDSVVENEEALRARVVAMCARFPTGMLIEEFIVGRDIVVPFLEAGPAATSGVLEPASYSYDGPGTEERKYNIYDFHLKTVAYAGVSVNVPADITPDQREALFERSKLVNKALGVRDLGRTDFRLADDGELYFLEINALPSLEQGASLYLSGALAGLDGPEAVLETVIRSAADRWGLDARPTKRRRRRRARVGLAFNLRRQSAKATDEESEYDTPETIAALNEALSSIGHDVVELEVTPELPGLLPAADVDVVFNIAEGFAGRNRESQLPALLELMNIPYTGSDSAALAMTLDKALAKRIASQAGVRVPEHLLMTTGKERVPPDLRFPVIVKPVAEGSSKGILRDAVVEDEAGLRRIANEVIERYRQPVMAEQYVSGREFTVALLGERRPKVLPPMEIVFTDKSRKLPIYDFASKFQTGGVEAVCPADIDPTLLRELERTARAVFRSLDCRDVARVDLRLDARGDVYFLECNPLPGLAPGFSDLPIIAEAAGMDYRTLIGEILAPALRRWREQRRSSGSR